MTSRTHTPEDVQKIIEPWRDSASDYERGFIDGMQKQMQSSVNKAVNRMAQPEQEPVGYWMEEFNDGVATLYEVPQESLFGRTYRNIPVYTTPPQRAWVGLTEAQCGVLWKTNMTPFEYYQAIDAKLKEKNT